MNTINIAVAGHTNTGKTTLIRTLMKTTIGEVSDSPNVTKRGEAYYFDGLQATFIDTPGFQHALATRMYLDLLNENPNLKHSQDWKSKLNYDNDAIQALENSDVVIYVASLSVVPDDSYKEELLLIKRKSSRIIAVINQYRRQLEATSDEKAVENRINQWIDVFQKQSIDKIITFDAHWDNPRKVNQLYDNILNILDDDQKSRFVEGLRRFKERQADIRQEACEMLASLIEKISEIELTNIPRRDVENKKRQNDAKEKVLRKINGSIAEFVYCVSQLYKIAAQEPTTSKEQLLLKMEPRANWRNRMGTGSGAAAILGAFSACFGGIFGAAVGLLTGGAAIITGAIAGAQLGGFIGTTIGSLAVFSDDNDTVAIKIEIEQIRTLFVTGIAIIWGLSSNGYGRDRELSSVESQQIEQQIKQHIDRLRNQCRDINLLHVNKIAIIKYCEKVLESIENEIE
ncbi:MAG: hypothetical protein C6Y22_07740 [Hapalosiphonaceae cyanobacterium JJU2]|nr:MAG: hypothetical protein C6Y22_07740 [Hapalosiphonaceae cyanobacterium JJU2]